MSDHPSGLRDLPDLASDVRERVVTPPYAEVSRRVRARRRRGAVGAMAAAVVLVGGLAVWQNASTTAGPSVPQPGGSTQGPVPPTDESQWRAVVDGANPHPFEVSGTDDGSIAVIWRALEQPEPTFALVIREADGTVHGRRIDVPLDLTPVPGGWVGLRTTQAFLIGSDGSSSMLTEAKDSRAPRPGDVVVSGQYGLWLYSPADGGWARMSFDGVAEGIFLTGGGEQVTCAREATGIVVRRNAQQIGQIPGRACALTGRGDTVAVAGLGSGPGGDIPLTGLLLVDGHDVTLPRISVQLEGVTSLVVTPAGSAMVTNASDGRWLVVGSSGNVAEPDRKLGEAFVAGDRLYASTYGLMDGPLFVSDDDGRTWQETTLPGNESSEE
jgi:hypothetical protein